MPTRKRPQIVLTLSPEALAHLDAESARTGLPRSRVVEVLLLHPTARAILDADESDPGRWLIEGPDGRVQSAAAWARELGISPATVRYRLRQGHEDADVLRKQGLQKSFSGRKKNLDGSNCSG